METRVREALDRFVAETKTSLGQDLRSIVLFGSAAEDALRPVSDVNVIVVARAYSASSAPGLRSALAIAGAAIRLRAMLLLDDEVAEAVEAFAVKFGDVGRRHRVLFGTDPFEGLRVPRDAAIVRLKQVLLNVGLRLRERWIARGDDEAALVAAAVDAAGPLRACAAEILELEGGAPLPPREALRAAAGEALETLSTAREGRSLPPGEGERLVRRLMEVTASLRARTERLS